METINIEKLIHDALEMSGSKEWIEECKKLDETNPDLYDVIGRFYEEREHFEEARVLYERGLEVSGNDRFSRGDFHIHLGELIDKIHKSGRFARDFGFRTEELHKRLNDFQRNYYIQSFGEERGLEVALAHQHFLAASDAHIYEG